MFQKDTTILLDPADFSLGALRVYVDDLCSEARMELAPLASAKGKL